MNSSPVTGLHVHLVIQRQAMLQHVPGQLDEAKFAVWDYDPGFLRIAAQVLSLAAFPCAFRFSVCAATI